MSYKAKPDQVDTGRFDATVGAASTGADYNTIQAAINSEKYNLLIIGDFTEADPGGITTGVNLVQIFVAKRLRLSNTNFTMGAGGIRVRGGIIEPLYTGAILKIFTSTDPSLPILDLADITFIMTGATAANSGVAAMLPGSKHLVHNCNFVLSNTSNCGFDAPGSNSSFTNLNVIGGGSNCQRFIHNMLGNGIISNINISGTFQNATDFIRVDDCNVVINNINSTVTQAIKMTGVGDSKLIISNVYGLDLNLASTTLIPSVSNCVFKDFYVSSAINGYYSNIKTTGSAAIVIYGDNNSYVNCEFNAAVTFDAGSNNNHLLLCRIISGVYTDNGTNNSYIEQISEDVLMTSDSNRKLITEHVAKTYADNIAKGITVDYYFSDTPDGVIANYDLMYPADTGQVESTAAASIIAADTLIASWITQTTEPNFTILLAGIYGIHIHAAKTAGTKDVYIYAKFYKRATGGSETLLATSSNSALLTGSNVGYTLHFSLLDDEIIDATDRLVVKFYGSPSGVGTDPTATLYLEGTNASRIDIHTTSSSWMLNLQNIIYVNGAGNDSNTGKNMGTPKLTIAAALTAAALQNPTSTNIVVVKVLGGLRYAEDVTVPSWIVLDMSDAISNGQVTVGVTMGADSFYYFNEAIMPSGKESVRCTGAGIRYIKGNFTTPEISSTFLSASGGAIVYLDIVNADAVKTGATFFTLLTGAVLFLKAQTFRETVISTSVGATVFWDVKDAYSNGDTININEVGNQIIRGKNSVSLGTIVANEILLLDGSYQKWTVNPHFIAYNPSQISDVTGDGTIYDIVLGNTDANIGSHYNIATGVFTAPVTGLYRFNIVLVLKGMSSAFTDVNIRVVRTGTAATWYLHQADPDKDIVGDYLILNGSIDLKLDSADTIKFQVQVVGGTKVVDVEQGTTFSGKLETRI